MRRKLLDQLQSARTYSYVFGSLIDPYIHVHNKGRAFLSFFLSFFINHCAGSIAAKASIDPLEFDWSYTYTGINNGISLAHR